MPQRKQEVVAGLVSGQIRTVRMQHWSRLHDVPVVGDAFAFFTFQLSLMSAASSPEATKKNA